MIVFNTIISLNSESTIYQTTPEQQKRVKEAIVQITEGKSVTNKQVESEIDKWLKER